MAGSPKYKVYSAGGEYIASCKDVTDAAAIVALRGPGATIRFGHGHVLWHEGRDGCAGESYDAISDHVHAAEVRMHRKAFARAHGEDHPALHGG